MRNKRLKQVKALIQQGPTGKFRWQTAPPEHACVCLEPFLPRACLGLHSASLGGVKIAYFVLEIVP
jgi:hypothetical protein